MSKPTKDEFEELKKRVEKLEQQQTEPLKITRIEIDPSGLQELLTANNKLLREIVQTQTDHSERFDTLKVELRQEVEVISKAWIEALQENVDDIKAGIANLKATQSDHGEMLKEHTKHLGRIEATMATKGDISALKTTQDEHSATLKAQGQMLKEI